MNDDIVKQWILKAERDLKIAKPEIKTGNPATDMVCFHMQQRAEKYLKTYLIFNGVETRKTHNLTLILEQCIRIDGEFQFLQKKQADKLTDYAIDTRYPADFFLPSVEETLQAINLAEEVKSFVLEKLKVSGFDFD